MTQKIAASLALIAFALCLLVGIQAGNTFATTVRRALMAMVGTYIVGLVLGFMGQRMINENVTAQAQKLTDSGEKLQTNDR